MRLWPKKVVSEGEAVEAFVEQTMRLNAERWPSVALLLRPLMEEKLEENPTFLDEPSTAFQFALARIALDLDTLPTFLPLDQAKRLRQSVQALMHPDPVLGPQSDRFFNKLADSAREVNASEFVARLYGSKLFAIYGITLFDVLDLDDYVDADEPVRSPVIVAALVSAVFELGTGWWKIFADRHRLAAT